MECRSIERRFPSVLVFPSCIWNSLSLAGSIPASCFQVELQCSPVLFHWLWHPLLPNTVFNILGDVHLRIIFMLWLIERLSSLLPSPVLVSGLGRLRWLHFLIM